MTAGQHPSGDAASSANQPTEHVDRYDLVLAAVPVLLATGAVADWVTTSGAWLAGGAALGALAVAYGLFGDPPTGPARSTR